MKVNWKIALPLCVGLIGGAAIVQGLHAQTQSPVLYIVDISEVVNAEGQSLAAAIRRRAIE
jgi:hypothetical protein